MPNIMHNMHWTKLTLTLGRDEVCYGDVSSSLCFEEISIYKTSHDVQIKTRYLVWWIVHVFHDQEKTSSFTSCAWS